MNTLTRKLVTGAAGGLLLTSLLASPAFAGDTSIVIKENGSDSVNKVKINTTCNSIVTQNNNSVVNTNLNVKTNTGGNKVKNSTDANVIIDTGDATSDITVEVGGSTNEATAENCCCDEGDVTIKIKDNGDDSRNRVRRHSSKFSLRHQGNRSRTRVRARVRARTGRNRIRNITGGTADIYTGLADSIIDVDVEAPDNTLNP